MRKCARYGHGVMLDEYSLRGEDDCVHRLCMMNENWRIADACERVGVGIVERMVR